MLVDTQLARPPLLMSDLHLSEGFQTTLLFTVFLSLFANHKNFRTIFTIPTNMFLLHTSKSQGFLWDSTLVFGVCLLDMSGGSRGLSLNT